jgi:hypothetical protein
MEVPFPLIITAEMAFRIPGQARNMPSVGIPVDATKTVWVHEARLASTDALDM